MKFYVVGLGPGDPELISVKASKILAISDTIFIPYSTNTNRSLALSIVNNYRSQNSKIIQVGFPMSHEVSEGTLKNIADTICNNLGNVNTFAVLGDPSLYSTFFRINKYLNCIKELEIVPGISSITACAAKANLNLANNDESIAIVTSSRIDLLQKIKDLFDCIVILKTNENINEIIDLLNSKFRLIYARRCFMDNERIVRLEKKDEISERDYFSMIIARRE
ncbi:MAG: cobalt-factor II C(20)-methyltransferase [Sulfolobaceae archaeon]